MSQKSRVGETPKSRVVESDKPPKSQDDKPPKSQDDKPPKSQDDKPRDRESEKQPNPRNDDIVLTGIAEYMDPRGRLKIRFVDNETRRKLERIGNRPANREPGDPAGPAGPEPMPGIPRRFGKGDRVKNLASGKTPITDTGFFIGVESCICFKPQLCRPAAVLGYYVTIEARVNRYSIPFPGSTPILGWNLVAKKIVCDQLPDQSETNTRLERIIEAHSRIKREENNVRLNRANRRVEKNRKFEHSTCADDECSAEHV